MAPEARRRAATACRHSAQVIAVFIILGLPHVPTKAPSRTAAARTESPLALAAPGRGRPHRHSPKITNTKTRWFNGELYSRQIRKRVDPWEAEYHKRAKPIPPEQDQSTPIVQRKKLTPMLYQLRFQDDDDALQAAEDLDGTELGGRTMRVTYDTERRKGSWVNVQGLSRHVTPEQLEQHFEPMVIKKVHKHEDILYAEVAFTSAAKAWDAKAQMDGTILKSRVIRVELDCSTDWMNKILVYGIHEHATWQELRDHFRPVGLASLAVIRGGPYTLVRYTTYDAAIRAVRELNRKPIEAEGVYSKRGLLIRRLYGCTKENTEVTVKALPKGANKDNIREHFSQMGYVEEILLQQWEDLPLEFCDYGDEEDDEDDEDLAEQPALPPRFT